MACLVQFLKPKVMLSQVDLDHNFIFCLRSVTTPDTSLVNLVVVLIYF